MTTITLDVPDDMAQRLQQLDPTQLITVLQRVLSDEELDNPPMKLLPAVPLPEPEFDISLEAWQAQLLTISAWSDEEIAEIEQARAYLSQWQPKEFF